MKHIFLFVFLLATITTSAQCSICFKADLTQDQLVITTDTNEALDIAIYDINGNLKLEARNTLNITFDTSTMAKGVYIIKVTNSKGEVETKKVVIKK